MSKRWKKPGKLTATAEPASLRIAGGSEGFALEALVAEADGKPKLRKFSMVAYTGGVMDLTGFFLPVVVDLAGVRVSSQTGPILRDHDMQRIVGHTESIEVLASRIKVAGIISGVGEDAAEVLGLAGNGFPWQASIGASLERLETVDRGETVKVNGRNFDGPLYVARATTLREVSFVAIGADANSSASVAAHHKGDSMNFDQWLEARGWDADARAKLSESQRTSLKAVFDAEQKANQNPAPTPQPIQAGAQAQQITQESAAQMIEGYRKQVAAETIRVQEIGRICAQYDNPDYPITENGTETTITLQAHAIATGWDVQRTELEALRRARAKAPVIHGRRQQSTAPEVLEAALCMSRGLPNIEKQFKPEHLEAAHKRFRNFGLHQLLITAAAQNGYQPSAGERIHTGNIREILKAAFSTVSLPGILGNVANKEILAGYMEEDQTWREIAAVKSVSNFYAVTSYRMLDDMAYEEVGAAGEIKHGSLGEESYTRQAKTFAKMFALTRQNIINDDLGAFDDLRNRIARGAAIKFNDYFWTEFLSDAVNFWTTARTNYLTGSTTTLLTDGVGLSLGVKAFRLMTSPTADGAKRIGGRPEILLVPPELENAADVLFANTNLGNVTNGEANIHANKYRPIVVPWLSDPAFTGYSTTAWYLLRNPASMPTIVVSFLNGQQTPTVESAEADFNVLGIQFRGYHDWGADQAEYLGGLKVKGAA